MCNSPALIPDSTPQDIRLPGEHIHPREYRNPLSRALAVYGLDEKAKRVESPTKSRSRGWANRERTEFYEDRQVFTSMLRADPRHAAKLSRERFEIAAGFARLAGAHYAVLSVTFKVLSVAKSQARIDKVIRLVEAVTADPIKQVVKGSEDGRTLKVSAFLTALLSPEQLFSLKANLGSWATVEVREHENDEGGVAAANDLREVLRAIVPQSARRQAKFESIIDGMRTVKTCHTSNLQRREAKLSAIPKRRQITSGGPLIDMPSTRPKSPKTGLPYHWMTINNYPEGTDFSQLYADAWVECPQDVPFG